MTDSYLSRFNDYSSMWDLGFGDEPDEYFEHEQAPVEPETIVHLNKQYERLNEQQKRAATAPYQPVLILAGAGTGKTHTIIHRAARMILIDNIHPAQILIVTFTKKAAGELKKRLETYIGPQARAMEIGTFHSIFASLLRKMDGATGVPPNYTILDPKDQIAMIQEAATEISPQYLADLKKDAKVSDIPELFVKFKSSKYPGQEPFELPPNVPEFERLYDNYSRLKRENNIVDYGDILFLFDKALDNPNVRKAIQDRYRAVIIDEYQDTDLIQETIIRKICAHHRNLTVVGDDDQSCYRWRDAKPENMLNFQKTWVEAIIVKLEHNYRSIPEILTLANNLISHNTLRHGKNLIALKESGRTPRFLPFQTEIDEANRVAYEMTVQIQKGIPPNRIAAISRTARCLQQLQHKLLNSGIKYAMHAGSSVADKIETKLIAAYIRAVSNPNDQTAFLYAFGHEARSIGKKTLDILKNTARDTGVTIETILRQKYRERIPKHKKLFDFLDALDEIRTLALLGETTEELFDRIVEATNINKMIDDDIEKAENSDTKEEKDDLLRKANDRKENLILMRDNATQATNIADLAANIVLSNEPIEDETDLVWLGTIHAAKGLEFDIVYVLGFEEGIIPSPRSTDKPSYEEERNLGLIAITRAERILTITYAEKRLLFGGGKGNSNTTGGPSDFVAETQKART